MSSSLGSFPPGSKVRLSVTFRDIDGALADPSDGTITVTDPAGTDHPVPFAQWVHDSLGVFHYDYVIPADVASLGLWPVVWQGEGSLAAIDDAFFYVPATPAYPSGPPPGQFATAAELAVLLGMDPAGLTDEWIAQADLFLQIITADIEDAAGVALEAGTGTVLLAGSWSRDLELPAGPVRSVSAVTVNGTAIDAGAYYWNGRNLIRRGSTPLDDDGDYPENATSGAQWRSGLSWAGPAATVRVTYEWGFVAIPTVLKGLALRIAARVIGNAADVTQESLAIYSVTYPTSAKFGSTVSTAERGRLRRMFGARIGGTITVAGR